MCTLEPTAKEIYRESGKYTYLNKITHNMLDAYTAGQGWENFPFWTYMRHFC